MHQQSKGRTTCLREVWWQRHPHTQHLPVWHPHRCLKERPAQQAAGLLAADHSRYCSSTPSAYLSRLRALHGDTQAISCEICLERLHSVVSILSCMGRQLS